jgi:branched-chain amino acid transport system permease protein
MDVFLLHLLNGLQLSMLIFLLAVGLTLIFGLMDILNLSHGAFYTIGAYTGLSIFGITGSFWIAIMLAPLLTFVLGMALQYFFLQPLLLKGRSSHLDLALFTFGLMFVTMGTIELLFGPAYATIAVPAELQGGIQLLGTTYPYYRLFIIGLGLGIAALLWLLIDHTVFGAIVRAGVDNRDMVVGMGVNISLVFALVFGIGTALAGLTGVVAAPVLSIYSQMGISILITALVVVIVGGLGNFKGSFYGAIIVGMLETMIQAYLPELQLFAIYILLAVVMFIRPQGLFGSKKQAA